MKFTDKQKSEPRKGRTFKGVGNVKTSRLNAGGDAAWRGKRS